VRVVSRESWVVRAAVGGLLAARLLIVPSVQAQARPFTTERYGALERVASPRISPDGNSIVFTRWHVDTASDRWVAALWLMDANGGHARELGAGQDAQWSPDGSRLAYLAQADGRMQLWTRAVEGSATAAPVTRGTSSPTAFRWSPDGRSLAFAAWAGSTHLFVVAVDGGDARDVTPGFHAGTIRPDGSEPAVFDWLPDGRSLLADGRNDSLATTPDSSTLQVIDVASAGRRPFLTQPGWWANPVVSPDGKSVAFLGRGRGGAPSVVNSARIDGALAHLVVPDLDHEVQSLRWSDKETLWFTTDDHGTRNSWSAQTTAKVPAAKPGSNGSHMITLGDVTSHGGFGVVVRTSPMRPEEIHRFSLKKPTTFTQLTHVNDDLIATLRSGEVEELLWRSADDVPLQGWLAKPPEFELSRKWPLLVRLATGPHAMATVAFNPENQGLAAQGMVVLTLNPRGATGYGSAFSAVSADSLLLLARRDVHSAIDQVLASGYIDSSRVYLEGGTLAASLLGHGARFRAAVLKASDDPPPLDGAPASWLARWPVANLAEITTPTLFVLDGPGESMSRAQLDLLFNALRARGVPTRLLRLPGEEGGAATSNWKRMIEAMGEWFK
jgi:dipeptidyl aminopeptidase/acylaminoacyl peptidase